MERARLKWRCRRGLAELDVMLGNFLDHGYSQLNSEQQQTFQHLLNYPDNELLDHLMLKTADSMDREIHDVVTRIRTALTHQHKKITPINN